MNVLVIGSGGREHALCWALAKSPDLTRLYCAPGNGGIEQIAHCVKLDADDSDAVITCCREHDIGLTIIGPEVPLVAGLGDDLTSAGLKVFGPSAAAARLEGSKGFTKSLCQEFNIPTARFGQFTNPSDAKAYIAENGAPIVIKADGLAAGKGVIIAENVADADQAIDLMFSGQFGRAGEQVVIEDFLEGEEASFFALVNGTSVLALASAQDHKRVGDGDIGPNTGGMGAYSPAPIMDDAMCARTMDEIIQPTINAMAARGTPYQGVLFAGLMITASGPELIEYNVRFGDPECQVLMMRLKSDLLAALLATVEGKLGDHKLEWHDEAALTVVMASEGYPGPYDKGQVIGNLEQAGKDGNVEIFHAGTRKQNENFLANGGRVLNVTALGRTVAKAQARAYDAVDKIDWQQGFCRRDIGWRAIGRR